MKLRVIIADDEPLACGRIRDLLADEEVEIVGECADGAETLKALQTQHPDLVFLDVQMPELDGFGVLGSLPPEQLPAVIFTTAHDEHAIRAFEVNAVDYLLKPFSDGRFRRALERVRGELENSPGHRHDPKLGPLLHQAQGGRIMVRSADRILFLKPAEIDHVEAAGNYVVLHAGKERHVVRETTAAMEARLTPAGFMRISRSVIVNLAQVREVHPVAQGQYTLVLKGGARLEMTCNLGELQSRLT